MFKLNLKKTEEQVIKFSTSTGSSKKQSNFIPLYYKYIKDIQATGLEKVGFISNPKERQCQRMFKLPHNCNYASKVMLKILQARLQQYMNQELPDFQAGFRKGRGTRDQWPTSIRSQKKQGDSRKTSISASLTILRPLTVWTTTNCGIFIKREEYQTSLSAWWETCMHIKKPHLEPDMEQQTVSKLGTG